MNLLINLIPIKSGGGQQVAVNLINQLLNNKEFSPFFLVTKNTIVYENLLKQECNNLLVVKKGLLNRLWFHLKELDSIVKKNNISIIYTMFGPGLHHKNVKSVTGCAYSNLFFPEIKFWKNYSFLERLKLRLIDNYRLKSTLRSDFIIFENESMQKRAIDLFDYPRERTKLILPSISTYNIDNDIMSKNFTNRLKKIDKSKFNILILSGWHKNKNIEIIPEILSFAKHKGVNDINFIITVSNDHPDSIKLLERAKELSVEKNIFFFNSVKPFQIPNLFKMIDGVGLFSLLESFSNNIIESWHFKKVLFISDKEWSRAICKETVVYVDRDNPENICQEILNYRSNKELQTIIKINSENILKNYPNPIEKVNLQLEFIKNIHEQTH